MGNLIKPAGKTNIGQSLRKLRFYRTLPLILSVLDPESESVLSFAANFDNNPVACNLRLDEINSDFQSKA